MIDKVNLKIGGHIKVYNGKELVFEEPNQIMPKALDIILRSLDTTQNLGVNKLRVVTSAGEVIKDISSIEISTITRSIRFTTILLESDFNGYINSLYLRSESEEPTTNIEPLDFSGKTGLSILKDSNTRLMINWEITINKI